MSPLFAPRVSSKFVPGKEPLYLNGLPGKHAAGIEPHLSVFSPRPSATFTAFQLAPGHCLTSPSIQSTARFSIANRDSSNVKSSKNQPTGAATVALEEQDITDASLPKEYAKPTKNEGPAQTKGDSNRFTESNKQNYWVQQYKPIKALSSGSEGTCTLVKHKKTRQLFALKVVSSPTLIDSKPKE
ncbi:MAG: hypothetical protein Q9164_006249, partial [Protoblastenia rupestris]